MAVEVTPGKEPEKKPDQDESAATAPPAPAQNDNNQENTGPAIKLAGESGDSTAAQDQSELDLTPPAQPEESQPPGSNGNNGAALPVNEWRWGRRVLYSALLGSAAGAALYGIVDYAHYVPYTNYHGISIVPGALVVAFAGAAMAGAWKITKPSQFGKPRTTISMLIAAMCTIGVYNAIPGDAVPKTPSLPDTVQVDTKPSVPVDTKQPDTVVPPAQPDTATPTVDVSAMQQQLEDMKKQLEQQNQQISTLQQDVEQLKQKDNEQATKIEQIDATQKQIEEKIQKLEDQKPTIVVPPVTVQPPEVEVKTVPTLADKMEQLQQDVAGYKQTGTMKSIAQRLNSDSPRVQVQAVKDLSYCFNNGRCGVGKDVNTGFSMLELARELAMSTGVKNGQLMHDEGFVRVKGMGTEKDVATGCQYLEDAMQLRHPLSTKVYKYNCR